MKAELSDPRQQSKSSSSSSANDLREVLERVQHAALASSRAVEEEADLARRVDALDRHRAQVSTRLAQIEKLRRAREAKLSDAAALLRRLAAG